MTTFFFVLLIISLANPCNSAPTQIEQCTDDSVCSREHYCHMQMYCEPCIPCEKTFNRQPARSLSLEITCAKHEEDCGNCIPEFHAEDWTHGRRSMKCLKIKRLAVSSDEPVLPNESQPVLKTFLLFIFVGFFATMGVAAYKYKSFHRYVSGLRTTNRGIELRNNPSVLALSEDQAKSDEGTMETDQLVPAIPTRPTGNEQIEDDNFSQAIPFGSYHTCEQPSETNRPTAPALEDIEDINRGSNDQSNDDPAEFVPEITMEPNPPTNAFQPIELLLDDGPVTSTENPSSSDVAVLPFATTGSRNTDEERSQRRPSSNGGELLELGFALCVRVKSFKHETENE